ncbi:hypothetical protein DFQ27_003056, partial [Actinomortierella ambigua]
SGEREEIPEDTPHEYRSCIEQCWHQDPNQRPEAKDVVLEDDVAMGSQLDVIGAFLSFGSSFNDSIGDRGAASGLAGALDRLTIVDNRAESLSNNNGDTKKEPHHGSGDEVIDYLRRVASKGNADAQLVLGWICDRGLDIAGKTEDAPLWYRKAAQQGHSTAQLRLGR